MNTTQLLILADIANGTYSHQRHSSNLSRNGDIDYLQKIGATVEGRPYSISNFGQILLQQSCAVASATAGDYYPENCYPSGGAS